MLMVKRKWFGPAAVLLLAAAVILGCNSNDSDTGGGSGGSSGSSSDSSTTSTLSVSLTATITQVYTGGESTLLATVRENGQPVADGSTVVFASALGAKISASSGSGDPTTLSGTAQATYTAPSTAGTDTVTASYRDAYDTVTISIISATTTTTTTTTATTTTATTTT